MKNIKTLLTALMATAILAATTFASAGLVDLTPTEEPSIVFPAMEDPVEPVSYAPKAEKPILLGIRKDGSYVVGKMIGGRMVMEILP